MFNPFTQFIGAVHSRPWGALGIPPHPPLQVQLHAAKGLPQLCKDAKGNPLPDCVGKATDFLVRAISKGLVFFWYYGFPYLCKYYLIFKFNTWCRISWFFFVEFGTVSLCEGIVTTFPSAPRRPVGRAEASDGGVRGDQPHRRRGRLRSAHRLLRACAPRPPPSASKQISASALRVGQWNCTKFSNLGPGFCDGQGPDSGGGSIAFRSGQTTVAFVFD